MNKGSSKYLNQVLSLCLTWNRWGMLKKHFPLKGTVLGCMVVGVRLPGSCARQGWLKQGSRLRSFCWQGCACKSEDGRQVTKQSVKNCGDTKVGCTSLVYCLASVRGPLHITEAENLTLGRKK